MGDGILTKRVKSVLGLLTAVGLSLTMAGCSSSSGGGTGAASGSAAGTDGGQGTARKNDGVQRIFATINQSSGSFFLTADNVLYATGQNRNHALGLENDTQYTKVTKLLEDVECVAASATKTLILKTDGTLLVGGIDGNGPKEIMQNVKYVYAEYDVYFAINEADELYAMAPIIMDRLVQAARAPASLLR